MVDFSLQNEKQFSNSEILNEQRAQTFFKECFTFYSLCTQDPTRLSESKKEWGEIPFCLLLLHIQVFIQIHGFQQSLRRISIFPLVLVQCHLSTDGILIHGSTTGLTWCGCRQAPCPLPGSYHISTATSQIHSTFLAFWDCKHIKSTWGFTAMTELTLLLTSHCFCSCWHTVTASHAAELVPIISPSREAVQYYCRK